MANRIFIASTGKDIGKTSISLGLAKSLIEQGYRVGYIKPIGQRFIEVDGNKISEDVYLMKRTYELKDNFSDMSPFISKRGLTDKYIKGNLKSPRNRIIKAFSRIENENDVVIIEGTGHAGVGSVFDLSNAEMAKMLDAPVLIVAEAGVGSTIDRITLNYTLFKSSGCTVLGLIINKVLESKLKKIENLLTRGIEKNINIPVFGFLPYKSVLLKPTLNVVKESLNLTAINEADITTISTPWNEQIEKVIIATMEPHVLMEEITNSNEKLLIISSSDRSDILLAILTLYHSGTTNILGVLLTGGTPPVSIMNAIKMTNLPVMVAKGDIYSIASMIHNLRIKITQQDEVKINILTDLFESCINKKLLYKGIFEYPVKKILWEERLRVWWERIKNFFSKIIKYLQNLHKQ